MGDQRSICSYGHRPDTLIAHFVHAEIIGLYLWSSRCKWSCAGFGHGHVICAVKIYVRRAEADVDALLSKQPRLVSLEIA